MKIAAAGVSSSIYFSLIDGIAALVWPDNQVWVAGTKEKNHIDYFKRISPPHFLLLYYIRQRKYSMCVCQFIPVLLW